MVYNTVGLGGAVVILYGPGAGQSHVLQGNDSVDLRNSVADPDVQAIIAQSGQIPSGANSILYYAKFGDGISVSFGGIPLTTRRLEQGANYDIWGADISGRGGQAGELRFTAAPGGSLDNIQFSPQIVPEPAVATVFFAGLLVFGSARMLGRQDR
jgi:hypothetical protein